MVKTVITPRKKTFSLTIPEDYVGKTLEILFYSIDEIADKKEPANRKPSDFFGTLTGQEGEKFQAYVNQSREISRL
jgi:hypothetical protein